MVDILLTKVEPDGLQSDRFGRTQLHWTVEHGYDYSLLDYGKKSKSWLNEQNRDKLKALHLTILYRNEIVVRNSINQGADYAS
jgi:ankyrin repeat protein